MKSTNKKARGSHQKWTNEEDYILCKLKQEKNMKSWKNIAEQINLHSSSLVRSGKQCRQRYLNYTRFAKETEANNGWTREQDEHLFQKFIDCGPKWVLLVKQFNGKYVNFSFRSENNIKNRFYNAIGRMSRKIKKVQLKRKLKNKKPINSTKLIKIFQELGIFLSSKPSVLTAEKEHQHQLDLYSQLAQNLIRLALSKQNQMQQQEIFNIINGIHDFSLNFRLRKSLDKQQHSSLLNIKEQKYGKSIFCVQKEDVNKESQINLDCLSNPIIIVSNQKDMCLQNLILPCELSYQNDKKDYDKNLDQELCIIQKKQYVPDYLYLLD